MVMTQGIVEAYCEFSLSIFVLFYPAETNFILHPCFTSCGTADEFLWSRRFVSISQ